MPGIYAIGGGAAVAGVPGRLDLKDLAPSGPRRKVHGGGGRFTAAAERFVDVTEAFAKTSAPLNLPGGCRGHLEEVEISLVMRCLIPRGYARATQSPAEALWRESR